MTIEQQTSNTLQQARGPFQAGYESWGQINNRCMKCNAQFIGSQHLCPNPLGGLGGPIQGLQGNAGLGQTVGYAQFNDHAEMLAILRELKTEIGFLKTQLFVMQAQLTQAVLQKIDKK